MEMYTSTTVLVVIFGFLLLPAFSKQQSKSKSVPRFPDGCGMRKTSGLRVVSGYNAGRWPWHALLSFRDGNNFTFRSSGVLIHEQWVLTCAHCVVGVKSMDEIQVVLGEYNRGVVENTEQIFNVSEIRMHHNYNVGPVLVNDIALIKLSKRVKYTHVIQPICLPPANEREAVGTKCSITGWGYTQQKNVKQQLPDILQTAQLGVVDFSKCNRTVKEAGPEGYHDNATQFCAGDGGKTNKSGCSGDSGGPFSCKENGRFVLRGILFAAQDPYCRTKARQSYTAFIRVSVYIDWIKDQMTTPPPKYPECKDNHWACCKFAKLKDCNNTEGFGYHLKYKYCPISCHNPNC